MKKLILMTAMAIFSAGAWGDWAVKGEGAYSCPEYLSAKRANSAKLYSSVTWVQGFITGVNYQRAQEIGSDSLIGQDLPPVSIVSWIENHCRDNLHDDIASAAEALVLELLEEE